MNMILGNKEIKNLIIGSQAAKSAWLGDQLVWSGDEPAPVEPWYLCFTAEQANSTVRIGKNGSAPSLTLEYSTDARNWQTFIAGSTNVTLSNVGDKVWLRAGTGGNERFSFNSQSYNRFVLTGKVAASGSVMSLLNGSIQLDTIPTANCFERLFFQQSALTQAPELPATTLANSCYTSMFEATSIKHCPQLPAMVTPGSCYGYMFYHCTSLLDAPELPATTVNIGSYGQMFNGCTALAKAPSILPALALPQSCYDNMFAGCTSLTQAPALPATTLATRCYYQMFNGCTHLESMDVSFTAWNPANATTNWMTNAGSQASGTKTFTCPAALGTDSTITRGDSNCLTGWTVVNPTKLTYSDDSSVNHYIEGDLSRQAALDAVQQDGHLSGELRYIDMGSQISAVAPSAFIDWKNIKGVVVGPNVETIGDNGFRRSQNISSFTFAGNALTSIQTYALGGIQNTEHIVLPDGLLEIGSNAITFGGANGWKVLEVPSTVSSLGSNAFGNNSGLLSVIFHSKTMGEVQAMSGYAWGASGKIFVD